jgi:hypothetical protein
MPHHKIDRESVRMLAIQVGVREAARRTGLNEDRVCQWSKRYKWLQQKTPEHKRANVSTVSTPGDILLEKLADDNRATKIGLSKAARKAAERLSAYSGEKVIGKAKQLREIAGAASTVHGWESAKGSGVNVMSQNAVVITDEQIADLRRRLARLRGDDVSDGLTK